MLQAKAEAKNPLIGNEPARQYATSQAWCFVIPSDGNPPVISTFPAPESIKAYATFQPEPARLVSEAVLLDDIARSHMPARWLAFGVKNSRRMPAALSTGDGKTVP